MPMSSQQEIHKHTLSNGLKILLIPSKRSPVVALQGWVKYGAADETEDIAGVAHLFEHLLFKGTTNRAVGEIAQEIEGLGGDLNAYTTYDHTVMHMTLASKHALQGLDILSDALLNSVVEEGELSNERPVILEEIKRRNDMPGAKAGDLFRGLLFKNHPYSRPVIGYDHVVENISRERIVTEYKNHYTTQNLFIVVSGDFDESKIIAHCEKVFKDTPSGPERRERPEVATITKGFSKFENHNLPDPIIHMGWRVPGNVGPEVAALDALALIVGQGESSRFHKRMVHEDKTVRSIGASVWSPRDDGSFSIGIKADTNIGKNMPAIERGIYECLYAEVTEKELAKAKKNLLSDAIYAKESVDGLADRYAYCESIADDWKADIHYLNAIKALKISDLHAARDKYLKWEQILCTGAMPEKMALPKFSGKVPAKKTVKLSTKTKSAGKHKFKKSTHGVYTQDFNGLKVLLRPNKEIPIFSLRWVGLGGQRLEPSNKLGIGSLWTRTVCDGARLPSGRPLSRDQINDIIDSSGASIASFHGRNSFGFQLDGLREDFEKLFEVLLASKESPTFDDKVFNQAKKHQAQDIKTQLQNPGACLSRDFGTAMFSNHAYGRNSLGDNKTLRTLKPSDALSYHKKLQKQPQVLCITGDVSPEYAQEILEKYLNEKSFNKTTPLSKVKPVKFKNKIQKTFKKLDKEQSHLFWGFPTCNMKNKDRWPLMALSSVLSGQGGRLFIELRDKMSLCYSVAPTHLEGIDGGYFAFYMGTSPEKVSVALDGMEKEINKIIDNGIPKSEWKKACNFVTGNHEIGQQSLGSQAMGMALDELYGLGFEEYFQFSKHLAKVKPEEIQKVVKKYLNPKKAKSQVFSVVGPQKPQAL